MFLFCGAVFRFYSKGEKCSREVRVDFFETDEISPIFHRLKILTFYE